MEALKRVFMEGRQGALHFADIGVVYVRKPCDGQDVVGAVGLEIADLRPGGHAAQFDGVGCGFDVFDLGRVRPAADRDLGLGRVAEGAERGLLVVCGQFRCV